MRLRARGLLEQECIPQIARDNIQVVKNINKVVDVYRQIQIGNKELRIRDLETDRIRQGLQHKGAELGNLVLSTSILISNLTQTNQVYDMDRIFQEEDEMGAQTRGTLDELSKSLKFMYASDAHEAPTAEFRAEVQRILERHGAPN